MKRYLIFLVVLLGATVAFGQNSGRIGIVVSSSVIDANKKDKVEQYFRDFLRDQYTVRIGRSDELFAERNAELRFQQTGSVDPEQVKEFGKFMGVDQLCAISVKPDGNAYNFSASIFNIENGELFKTAQYPDLLRFRTDLDVLNTNTSEIARVSGHLLLRLGILSPENKKIVEDNTTEADNELRNRGNKEKANKRKVNAKALGLSIIPGVGLMQKGRTGEGVAYLLGDITLVGGGIGMLAYANKQQDIMNDRNTTFDQYNTAKNNYNTAKTVSYCCFGTAAALYVVNLVRSYVAEPKPGARIQWAVVPSMNPTSPYGPNMSVNLALAYKF